MVSRSSQIGGIGLLTHTRWSLSAAHFQLLLERYPPQTSSKVAVSQWLCAIHNKVNERLGKEMFDCADIQEKYQCGCEADEKEEEEEDSTHSNT